MKPKRAPKRGLTSRKLALTRAVVVYGKTLEEVAEIYGITPRCVRRALEWFETKAGVFKKQDLLVWKSAHDLVFCSEETKADYLERERKLREAA